MIRWRDRSLSIASYRKVTLLALIALGLIVISGGAVRLSSSGLGCEDWPRCTQDRFVAPLEYHALVEFVNRMFTGIVSVAVILAVLGALAVRPRRRDLTYWSLGLVAGVIGQIVLGGLVVLFDLSPWLVIGHFVLSIVLVWNAVVLHHRAANGDGPRYPALPPRLLWLTRTVVGGAIAVIATGTIVTGSGPHSGAHTGQPVHRLPFAVPHVARIHGIAMVLFLSTVLLLGWMLRPAARLGTDPAEAAVARNDLSLLLTVLVAQAAVGYTQYFTDVPPVLVGIHLAGATVLWIVVVRFYLRRFHAGVAIGLPTTETVPDGAANDEPHRARRA
jgi:cytochrome c oxidase assembly protein subunit 15